jgi:hypothetical protein
MAAAIAAAPSAATRVASGAVIGRVVAHDIDHRRRGLAGIVQVGQAVREAGTEMQQGRCRLLGHARIAVGRTGRHALE